MVEVASLRERKKEQTRVELTRAAVKLFRERGFENTTVDDIVDAADYSRSTFFRYFGSKEDVVFGEIPERMTALPALLRGIDAGGDPWLGARKAVTGEIPHFADAQDLDEAVALWFSEPALQRRYAEINLQCEQMMASYFGAVWGVDPEVSVECQVAAAAAIGVARAALRVYRSDRAGVIEALERGFDLLEGEIKFRS